MWNAGGSRDLPVFKDWLQIIGMIDMTGRDPLTTQTPGEASPVDTEGRPRKPPKSAAIAGDPRRSSSVVVFV